MCAWAASLEQSVVGPGVSLTDGDMLTVRCAAGGSVPACEETYEVVADEHGWLILNCLSRSRCYPFHMLACEKRELARDIGRGRL